MLYVIDAAGWFSEIGGRPVVRRDMRYLGATTYRRGFPEGVLWHYTAGCNADISGSMVARGYPTACGSVGRGGELIQYLPLEVAGYHAYDASRVYFGLEHTALPGVCELTDVELKASADYSAAIVAAVEERHHFTIPLDHIPGCVITAPGFKEHKDGVGCAWDPKTHTDNLYRWGWDRYLAAVDKALGGDDMAFTPEQEDYIKGMMRFNRGDGPPKDDASDQLKRGFNDSKSRWDRAMASPPPTGLKPFDATITPKA